MSYEPRDATIEDHQDDSYGACVICRWYRPHTDDEWTLVPYPCAVALLRDGIADAESEVIAALEELDKVATWSALNRPEYPRLRAALDSFYAGKRT